MFHKEFSKNFYLLEFLSERSNHAIVFATFSPLLSPQLFVVREYLRKFVQETNKIVAKTRVHRSCFQKLYFGTFF